MAEVQFENATKIFPNGVAAVRDFTLAVQTGEIVTLVGPSGCGKTTSLRLIAGLEDLTSGTIRLQGKVANQIPPRDRNVAMVFQKHSTYPHLSVRGNLAFPLRLRKSAGWWKRFIFSGKGQNSETGDEIGEKDTSEKVMATAKLLNLVDVLDQFPHQLSGGQQQRAALGRAMVRDPAIFLLDEPLSHLDAHLRAEVRGQLHLLHRRLNATIIYVTHDQHEAMTFGDRLVVMDKGTIQQVGPPTHVYNWPRNRFVAGFLGWPPMSFLDGQLVRKNCRFWFVAKDWQFPLIGMLKSAADDFSETRVTLGIRPEHVKISATGPDDATLAMETAVVEPLGSENLLTLERGKCRVTARVCGRIPFEMGAKVKVEVDMRQVCFFDETGEALDWRGPAG